MPRNIKQLTTIQTPVNRRGAPLPRAFSLTELLVVIGIIALLVSLLLVALGPVRTKALETKTMSIMNDFASGCEAFQMDHGRYPGFVPTTALNDDPQISEMESAILDMVGGRVSSTHPKYDDIETVECDDESDPDAEPPVIEFDFANGEFKMKYITAEIGLGPQINGRAYSAYYPGELAIAQGQWDVASGGLESTPMRCRIPDLVDAWGQPMIFLRQIRKTGPLVSDDKSDRPQFLFGGMKPYLDSEKLGKEGRDQTQLSILNLATDPSATLAQIIRNPSLGDPQKPLLEGVSRGAFILISAGADGVFFSHHDGPGTPASPVINIVDDTDFGTPKSAAEYDDLIRAGGSS